MRAAARRGPESQLTSHRRETIVQTRQAGTKRSARHVEAGAVVADLEDQLTCIPNLDCDGRRSGGVFGGILQGLRA